MQAKAGGRNNTQKFFDKKGKWRFGLEMSFQSPLRARAREET